MPIEVRELVIKATVIQEDTSADNSSESSSAGKTGTPMEEMIHICVEQVLQILKERNER